MTPPKPAFAALAAASLLAPLALGQGESLLDPTLGDGSEANVIELSLGDALRIGVGNDLGLRQQEIVAESASYDVAGSWGAFDPLLTANASFTDAESEAANAGFGGIPATIEDEIIQADSGILFPLTTGGNFSLTFDVTNQKTNNPFIQSPTSASLTTHLITAEFVQPLLRNAGHKVATSLQREFDLEYKRQVEALRRTRQTLVASIEFAYWDLVAAIAQLKVAEETLALGLQQLEQNQRRLDAGVGTQVDVLQARATVAQREELRLLRETEVAKAEDALKAVLYPGTRADIWDSMVVPTTDLPEAHEDLERRVPPWTNALLVALESRAELREQRLEIDKAEQVLLRSSSDRRPALDLTLRSRARGLDSSGTGAFDKALGWDFPTHTAAVTFSVPLRNRTNINAERRARAQLRGARLSYDQIESQIVAEVRDAVRQVAYSLRAAQAAIESETLAQSQLDAEQARYREGLSTNFQVLEFQQQLAEVKFSRTAARANLAKALTALEQAQGVLGELRP